MKILRYNQVFEQNFAFDSNKDSLLNLIKRIKENGLHPLDANIIYGLITGERKLTNMFNDEIKNKWKEYFKSNAFVTDGVWSERRFNNKLKRNNDRTYNYYISISKDAGNIMKFISKLQELDSALNKISNENKECVAYKTHTLLDMMVNHNDSLKIYYYNPKLKDNIENIVKDWVIKNNIKLDNRLYHHGVDIKQKDGEKDSYGIIVAKLVAEKLGEIIKKYGNKYSDEAYFKWLKDNIDNIIKSIKINYNK